MDWNHYKQIVDIRVSDAWYNLNEAEKKYKECKMVYDGAIREREAFEKALDVHLNELDEKGVFVDVRV